MKKSTAKTFSFALIIVVVSVLLLFTSLTVLGAFPKASITQEAPPIYINNITVLGINAEDYETYKLVGMDFAQLANSSGVVQSTVLDPRDAAVLAAKQLEGMIGTSFAGCVFNLISLDGYQIGFNVTLEGVSKLHFVGVNSVTGELLTFTSAHEFTKEEKEYMFTQEDTEACNIKALEIASTYFITGINNAEIQADTRLNVHGYIYNEEPIYETEVGLRDGSIVYMTFVGKELTLSSLVCKK